MKHMDSRDVTNVPARTRYTREREAIAIRARTQIYRGIGMVFAIVAVILTLGIAGYTDALELMR